jgi:hypothetical protein
MTATPPTFVAKYDVSSWSTTSTPKTASPTIAANDVLIIGGLTANDTTQIGTPTDNLGTHLTYDLLESIQVTDYCWLGLWAATVSGGQSGAFTLSAARQNTADAWGFEVLRFSGVSSIGNHAKANAEVASGGQSLSLTTAQENSVVVCFAADWTADTTTPTWRTVNGITPTAGNGQRTLFQATSSVYTVHGAYYTDAGAAGANLYGASSPADQKYSIAAVELKGVLTGGPAGFGVGFFDGI